METFDASEEGSRRRSLAENLSAPGVDEDLEVIARLDVNRSAGVAGPLEHPQPATGVPIPNELEDGGWRQTGFRSIGDLPQVPIHRPIDLGSVDKDGAGERDHGDHRPGQEAGPTVQASDERCRLHRPGLDV